MHIDITPFLILIKKKFKFYSIDLIKTKITILKKLIISLLCFSYKCSCSFSIKKERIEIILNV